MKWLPNEAVGQVAGLHSCISFVQLAFTTEFWQTEAYSELHGGDRGLQLKHWSVLVAGASTNDIFLQVL